jgi:hypothetical protein
MKLKLAVLVFCLLFLGSTAFSSSTYYIPQVAIGAYTGADQQTYGYRTTFVFFNNTSSSSTVAMSLAADDGTEMTENISGLGTNSTFSFLLGPGSTRIYQTDSSGSIHTGAATITSDSDIGVSGIYTISKVATGQFVTEVGVQATSLMSNFAIPVQVTANGAVTTGLALYNPNTSNSTITLSLKNTNGTSAGANVQLTLAAGKHTAFYITDKFSSINNTAFSGMLTVQSSAAISAVTLRQNAPSNVTYTSIPVVPTSSTQTTFNLAHLADGQIGGTPYKTTFMLFNFSGSSATVTIAPSNDDGTALTLSMTDGSATGSNYTIAAGASKFLQTNGAANAQGAAIITSNVPIGAAALFTEYNNDQSFNTEAGVQDSAVLTNFTLPVDSQVPLDGTATIVGTAFAFFNPTSSSVTLTPTYLDEDGLKATGSPITLQPHAHQAKYFNEMFSNLGFVKGSLAFAGSSGVSAMVLRANAAPFNMTSLSAVSGTAPGLSWATSGSYAVTKAIYTDITKDLTINRTLNYADVLTVSWSGYAAPSTNNPMQAQAISQSSGRIYRPKTDINTATTSSGLYVPKGTFRVRTMGWLPNSTAASGIYATYTTDPFLFTSTTTQNVNVVAPATYNVSGTIADYGSLGITTSAALSFFSTASSDSHGQYLVYCSTDEHGAFAQNMPAGDYIAVLKAPNIGTTVPGATENLGLKIGTFSVTGDDTIVNDLTIPTIATLSGTANFAGGSPLGPFTITAADNSLPNLGYINSKLNAYPGYYSSYYPPNTTWTKDTFGGAYSESIGGDGHNYNLSYSFLVYNSTGTSVGTACYSPSSGAAVPVTGTAASYNFDTLPSLPSLVTLSGTVNSATGSASTYTTVIVRSDSIIGVDGNIIPGLSYYATTPVDTSGHFNLSVLPGHNYQVYYSGRYVMVIQ